MAEFHTNTAQEERNAAELITDKCALKFCQIHTLLNLMEREVAEHNSTDFDVIEALLPAVRAAVESAWEMLEKSNNAHEVAA